MKFHAKLLTSAVEQAAFPPEYVPEIAFLGRSNVGKSSLINSLLGAKTAFVSRTPGRTQTINFFELRRGPRQFSPEMLFVDLPGYGYARVPKAIVKGWPRFIDPYLSSRESLVLCVCLVDASVPPQESDLALQDFLRAAERPVLTVATKSDRLSGNKLAVAMRTLEASLNPTRLLRYSAKTGLGRDELWREILGAALPQRG